MKVNGIAFSKEELEKKGITVCEVKEDMQMIFPGVTLYRNFERIVGYEQLNPRFFVKKEDKEIVAGCFAESFFQTCYRKKFFIQRVASEIAERERGK